MTEHNPDTAPQPGNYDTLRQRVATMVSIMPRTGPDSKMLAPPELSTVLRGASMGVLRQLQEAGVEEAGTLAIHLGEAAQFDDFADLSHTVADRFTQAQGMRESGGDANAQAQQQRMALLAGAAGETAIAIVGSVLNPDNLTPLVNSGQKAIEEYATATHKNAGIDLLTGLLNQAEAA